MKILALVLMSLALIGLGCSQVTDEEDQVPTSQPNDCKDGKCKPRVEVLEEVHCASPGIGWCPVHGSAKIRLTVSPPHSCEDCLKNPKCDTMNVRRGFRADGPALRG